MILKRVATFYQSFKTGRSWDLFLPKFNNPTGCSFCSNCLSKSLASSFVISPGFKCIASCSSLPVLLSLPPTELASNFSFSGSSFLSSEPDDDLFEFSSSKVFLAFSCSFIFLLFSSSWPSDLSFCSSDCPSCPLLPKGFFFLGTFFAISSSFFLAAS